MNLEITKLVLAAFVKPTFWLKLLSLGHYTLL